MTIHTLISAADLAARVAALGAALARSHADRAPLVLGTLTGAFIFTADLVRAMAPVPAGMGVDFVRAASYAGTRSTGDVVVGGSGGGGGGGGGGSGGGRGGGPGGGPALGTKVAVAGRHVILVEDIVDTGRTLAALVAALVGAGAASVATVALLDKPSGRAPGYEGVAADHVGFRVGDEFVVGYGLDWDEAWRGLPFVGVVREEEGEAAAEEGGEEGGGHGRGEARGGS
jgi:hypoxanthine phosphoribosyltransferase